jgi:hypothetical protein
LGEASKKQTPQAGEAQVLSRLRSPVSWATSQSTAIIPVTASAPDPAGRQLTVPELKVKCTSASARTRDAWSAASAMFGAEARNATRIPSRRSRSTSRSASVSVTGSASTPASRPSSHPWAAVTVASRSCLGSPARRVSAVLTSA